MRINLSAMFGLVLILVGMQVSVLKAEETPEVLHISTKDFATKQLAPEIIDGHPNIVIQAQTRTKRLARELGYSQIRAWYDTVDKITRKVVLMDDQNQAITTVRFLNIIQSEGGMSASQMEVKDHETGKLKIFQLHSGQQPFSMM